MHHDFEMRNAYWVAVFFYADYAFIFWFCEHGQPNMIGYDMYPDHVPAEEKSSWP